ncbi:MAG: 5-formyltetrahydrofolate cyclo-ligase [Clostridia bacterium]|nr:5-formyltetrahydrofolate cyclo-ligase [Clostridia bacterium]
MNKFKFVTDTAVDELDVKAKKKALRKYMKERRADNENRDVKETLLVENTLDGLREILQGKETFFVYLAKSSEAPTEKLIERLLSSGKKVYCPCIDGNEMQAVAYGDDFTLSQFQTVEPVGPPYEGQIDVALVPLLAADRQGGRLGYGGGYYDRFFASRPNLLKIGYCFDFQLTQKVPTEATDVPLNIVVTDKQIIFCGR